VTWSLAAYDLACCSCRAEIPKGTPVRRVTVGRHPWCCACAKKHLDEDPPLVSELAPRDYQPASSGSGVMPFEPISEVAKRVEVPHDRKRAASGDDE
jgi:hypothetical protein